MSDDRVDIVMTMKLEPQGGEGGIFTRREISIYGFSRDDVFVPYLRMEFPGLQWKPAPLPESVLCKLAEAEGRIAIERLKEGFLYDLVDTEAITVEEALDKCQAYLKALHGCMYDVVSNYIYEYVDDKDDNDNNKMYIWTLKSLF